MTDYLIGPSQYILAESERNMTKLSDAIDEKNRREEQYKIDSLEALKAIQKNTDVLDEFVSLVRANGEKQDEILAIVTEILAISVSQDKEEAESRYRKVMNKITNFSGSIETVQKLTTYGIAVFNFVQPLLK